MAKITRTAKLKTVKLLPAGGVLFKKSPSFPFFFARVFQLIGRPLLLLTIHSFKLLRQIFINFLNFYHRKIIIFRLRLSNIKFSKPSFTLPRIHIQLPHKLPRKSKTQKPKIFILARKTFLLPLSALMLGLAYTLILAFYFAILRDLPSATALEHHPDSVTTKIYDRSHTLLYKIHGPQNRSLVQLEDIPPHLIRATIAIEDKEFYDHPGISTRGLARAFYRNIIEGDQIGGSTITQQLIKNTLLTSERTYQRKLKEMILAFNVERLYSKDQILEMYLNQVGYGGSAYGVEEASQLYFGKSVTDLTLPEAALLAGLPASPTTYSPFGAHPDLAHHRQKEVLALMFQNSFITYDEYKQALEAPVTLATPKAEILAPHFVMYVKNLLVQKYGEQMVERGGLEVVTSLDLNIQNQAQDTVTKEIESLAKLHISNGAALVTHPQTGEILAMVGSKNYFDTGIQGNFNVTTAERQPGSSIKPIMYSLALENGHTPGTLIEDSPVTFHIPGQPPYSPKNYDNRYHGQVPLRTALASSFNIPAVKTLAKVGVPQMLSRGRDMGITTWTDPSRYGLSLTLGGGEVKMTDMAVAYGTIANLGSRVQLQPILKVTDYKGQVLEEYDCSSRPCVHHLSEEGSAPNKSERPVIDPKVAFQLIDILSDNLARSPAFGTRSTLVIPDHPHVAVKTGTTNNLKDNWTIGFTQDYLVATWVGNNDSTPMSYVASGVTGASPIWQKIIYSLIKDTPDVAYSPPADLVKVEICALTGTRSCSECPVKRVEYFTPGTEPQNVCNADMVKNFLIRLTPTPVPQTNLIKPTAVPQLVDAKPHPRRGRNH